MHQREASQGRAHGRPRRQSADSARPYTAVGDFGLPAPIRRPLTAPPFKPVVMIQRQRIVPSRVMLPEALQAWAVVLFLRLGHGRGRQLRTACALVAGKSTTSRHDLGHSRNWRLAQQNPSSHGPHLMWCLTRSTRMAPA